MTASYTRLLWRVPLLACGAVCVLFGQLYASLGLLLSGSATHVSWPIFSVTLEAVGVCTDPRPYSPRMALSSIWQSRQRTPDPCSCAVVGCNRCSRGICRHAHRIFRATRLKGVGKRGVLDVSRVRTEHHGRPIAFRRAPHTGPTRRHTLRLAGRRLVLRSTCPAEGV